jgi:hypothetical protein
MAENQSEVIAKDSPIERALVVGDGRRRSPASAFALIGGRGRRRTAWTPRSWAISEVPTLIGAGACRTTTTTAGGDARLFVGSSTAGVLGALSTTLTNSAATAAGDMFGVVSSKGRTLGHASSNP